MTWLLWRQNRLSTAIAGALFAAFALALAITGIGMSDRLGHYRDCLADRSCDGTTELDVLRGTEGLRIIALLSVALPLLLGVFFGATVLAREFEAGTHAMIWSQSVSRGRWLAGQLAVALGATVLWAGAVSAMVTWWFGPENSLHGTRFDQFRFDVQNLAPVSYALFATALGLAAGAFFRRIVPALAVAILGFGALRLFVLIYLRQHFMTPMTKVLPFGDEAPANGAWVLSTRMTHNGVPTDHVQLNCPGPIPSADCVSQAGYAQLQTYQPSSRYWTFQWIEFGLFAGLAALLVVAAVVIVRRRDA